jgi:hypothetical protein
MGETLFPHVGTLCSCECWRGALTRDGGAASDLEGQVCPRTPPFTVMS